MKKGVSDGLVDVDFVLTSVDLGPVTVNVTKLLAIQNIQNQFSFSGRNRRQMIFL